MLIPIHRIYKNGFIVCSSINNTTNTMLLNMKLPINTFLLMNEYFVGSFKNIRFPKKVDYYIPPTLSEDEEYQYISATNECIAVDKSIKSNNYILPINVFIEWECNLTLENLLSFIKKTYFKKVNTKSQRYISKIIEISDISSIFYKILGENFPEEKVKFDKEFLSNESDK